VFRSAVQKKAEEKKRTKTDKDRRDFILTPTKATQRRTNRENTLDPGSAFFKKRKKKKGGKKKEKRRPVFSGDGRGKRAPLRHVNEMMKGIRPLTYFRGGRRGIKKRKEKNRARATPLGRKKKKKQQDPFLIAIAKRKQKRGRTGTGPSPVAGGRGGGKRGNIL